MNGIDRNIVIIEGEKDCSEYLMWKLLSETEFVGIDNIVCARSYKGIINNLNLIRDILFRYRVSARVLVCYDTTGYKKLVDRLKNLVISRIDRRVYQLNPNNTSDRIYTQIIPQSIKLASNLQKGDKKHD